MKIFLDECVPTKLARLLPEHECLTSKQMGWTGIQNGRLLALVQGEFDVFLTADKNLRNQQNLKDVDIAIVQISTNNVRVIEASIGTLREVLSTVSPGLLVTADL